jgi:predicted nucleic acid-binding protein
MIIIVNDANILIDLLKIHLINSFFRLDFEMHITNLCLGEIEEENSNLLNAYVESKQLIVREFNFNEVMQIKNINNKYYSLSLEDSSCLWLCKNISALLLTGEKTLRSIAESNGIEVHGILWIFEELLSQQTLDHQTAIQKLKSLIMLNQRLPLDECRKCIKNWEKEIEKRRL